MKPAIIRSVVVLPHPDGPSREKNSPAAMSRSRSSTTVVPPNDLRQAAQRHRGLAGRWSAIARSSRGCHGVVIGVRLR